MIKFLPGEKWSQLKFENWRLTRKRYAVSSFGRLASYTQDLKADGDILKGTIFDGYHRLNLHIQHVRAGILLHRAVAEHFVRKPSPRHKFVIHVDHNKLNNKASNLRWATQQEVTAHQQKSPATIAAREKQAQNPVLLKKGLKLTLKQVQAIKKVLASPKRNLTHKQIAEKYGVSEMAIYRIKSGENWKQA